MERAAPAVIDASVVAKWFLDEPDSDAALRVREAHLAGRIRLLSPTLMVYEVANALRYHPQVGADLLSEHTEDLLGLGIALDPAVEESLAPAVRTAYRAGITVYDAAYLALAERMDCNLLTADEVQLRASGPRGTHIREWVE